MNETSGTPSRLTLMALDDRKIIGYRPRLNAEIGSVLSTIVLCQAMYWAQHAGNPFYKFIQPCNHQMYRSGDSWVEELGFTRHEFEFAIKRIGQKITKASPERSADAFIWYWTDMHRVSWWQINWDMVNGLFDKAYPLLPENGNSYFQKVELPISTFPQYVKPESGFTYNEHRLTSETTQRVSSSSAPLPEKAKDEDDDLNRILLDLGLNRQEAKDARDRHGDLLCHEKAKELIRSLDKIKNLGIYARTTYAKAELYPPAQAEAIRQRKYRSEERRKELDSSLRWNDEFHEIPLPVVTEEQIQGYISSIKNNSLLKRIWDRDGLNSAIIRVSVGEYISLNK